MRNIYHLHYTKQGIFIKHNQSGKIMNHKTPYKYSQQHLAEKYKYKLECLESDRIMNNIKKNNLKK